jgi:hypothetical protein
MFFPFEIQPEVVKGETGFDYKVWALFRGSISSEKVGCKNFFVCFIHVRKEKYY